jgi:hypothetical protein
MDFLEAQEIVAVSIDRRNTIKDLCIEGGVYDQGRTTGIE